MSASALRRCLEECDVAGARALWAQAMPHLPQPKTDADALAILHCARTEAESIAFKLRAYSHRWLSERGYPSRLPDQLRQSAERLYPRIAAAVGISVNMRSAVLKPIEGIVRSAMQDAVLEAEGDGKLLDAAHVSARMKSAREKTIKQLLGSVSLRVR